MKAISDGQLLEDYFVINDASIKEENREFAEKRGVNLIDFAGLKSFIRREVSEAIKEVPRKVSDVVNKSQKKSKPRTTKRRTRSNDEWWLPDWRD